ncbi:hypothetical protein ACODNH_22090 [Haloarcula sp. NS06]|uniref:hypothetical protein n=1 Tax=unclassified Haloarcula TaxID=2624677 RepID=UPI0027B207F8|nr:hypothetical protein [Haloarcula sp. H-GB4]MDQ2074386.1 hypothetical protein [Haloarcula sp. H-GB4]
MGNTKLARNVYTVPKKAIRNQFTECETVRMNSVVSDTHGMTATTTAGAWTPSTTGADISAETDWSGLQ